MKRSILSLAVIASFSLVGCASGMRDDLGPVGADVRQQDRGDVRPQKIVTQFVHAVGDLAGTYPELAAFNTSARTRFDALDVPYQRGVHGFSEQRGVRPGDIDKGGIHLRFRLVDDDNPVWAQGDQLTALPNLGLELSADLVLPAHASPGLEEDLRVIIARYESMLRKLDAQAAQDPQRLKVRIVSEQTSFRVGEPVTIMLMMRRLVDEAVFAPPAYWSCVVKVDGKAFTTPYGRGGGAAEPAWSGPGWVPKDSEIGLGLTLSHYHGITKEALPVGTHEIVVTIGRAVSNTLTITVVKDS